MAYLFSQDWITPAIAFTMSAIGSFLGLSFASRARRTTGFFRWQWLGLAALSLGGLAVWSMHAIAMLGYSVSGTAIRYDTLLTVASGIVPILVMGVALHLVVRRSTLGRLLFSGFLLGLGILAMHYLGMAAMNLHGEMHHSPGYVALAGLIAVVAATVALVFARHLRHMGTMALASLVMAGAITAMHYTGMAGVHIIPPDFDRRGPPSGVPAPDLMLPLIMGLFIFLLICSLFLLLSGEDDRPRPYNRPSHRSEEHTIQSSDASYVPRHGAPGDEPEPLRRRDDLWSRPR